MAGRGVAYISKVPTQAVSRVSDYLLEQLKTVIPPVLHNNLKVSVHETHVSTLKDLSFHLERNLGLKTLMRYYGEDTLNLKELWHTPIKEDLLQPYNQPCHDVIIKLNNEILDDSTHPFWTYATKDIEYLHVLDDKLNHPDPNHDDTMAHIVGYTKYHGIPFDREILEKTAEYYRSQIKPIPGLNMNSATQKLALLREHVPFIASVGKDVCKAIAENTAYPEKARELARLFYMFGEYTQRLNQVERLLRVKTDSLHPSFNVFGTATGRMSGSGGLNAQGFPRIENGLGIRRALLLNSGGDFANLEVNIAAWIFNDQTLIDDILTGKDLHSNTATLIPEVKLSYDEFIKVKNTPEYKPYRQQAKRINFALQYCGSPMLLGEILGDAEVGQRVYDAYYARYSGIAKAMEANSQRFEVADTDKWTNRMGEMADYVENVFGGRRYFTFEKAVATLLWEIGMQGIKGLPTGSITRQKLKGVQTITNAVKSACLGAAINITHSVARRGFNFYIQSTGATITKKVCEAIWLNHPDPMMNIHDEVVVYRSIPHEEVNEVVQSCIARLREETGVKTLKMDFEETEYWSH